MGLFSGFLYVLCLLALWQLTRARSKFLGRYFLTGAIVFSVITIFPIALLAIVMVTGGG